MPHASVTRRRMLQGSLALGAVTATGTLRPGRAWSAAKPVTVGFVYVGPRNDFGWNQSHWVAARKIASLTS